MTKPIETDALIIGAGPVGLFQAFELGLLGIKAHIVDAMRHEGGQCAELYPDKPIYDIPGTVVTTGQELTQKLMQQIEPFDTQFHFQQTVDGIERQADHRFLVQTSTNQVFLTKTIFIAAGVGAFLPRQIGQAHLDRYLNKQVFYETVPSPYTFPDKHIVIVGDSERALNWATTFVSEPDHVHHKPSHRAAHVTLIHRREVFDAPEPLILKMNQLRQAGKLDFIAAQIVDNKSLNDVMTHLSIVKSDGIQADIRADLVFGFLGLSPKLGPIANWGLDIQRKQIAVDTEKFQTSESGIFAVGDINTYPGKKKLILCGFHEAALASFAAAAIVFPDKPIQLQYTTTSSLLHERLGVKPV
jgi:thioredoxin reductase (NADPH)